MDGRKVLMFLPMESFPAINPMAIVLTYPDSNRELLGAGEILIIIAFIIGEAMEAIMRSTRLIVNRIALLLLSLINETKVSNIEGLQSPRPLKNSSISAM
ncbi:MAG: hypothetical protein QXR98_06760, partial [Fervidicoccaceae archaeon]